MPNIVTHALITSEVFPSASPDLVLGSTLPDFIGMHRDYNGSQIRPKDLAETAFAEGVRFHARTDEVFDSNPGRTKLLVEAREDLTATIPTITRGALHTLINVGTDILFDVKVLESDNGQTVYEKTKRDVLDGHTSLGSIHDVGFEELVTGYFISDRAYRYADTEWVADMIRNRMVRRKNGRFSFERELVPKVAESFDRILNKIDAHSGILLSSTIEQLKS